MTIDFIPLSLLLLLSIGFIFSAFFNNLICISDRFRSDFEGVNYARLAVIGLKAAQELLGQVEQHKAQMEQLETANKLLETKLAAQQQQVWLLHALLLFLFFIFFLFFVFLCLLSV